MLLPVGERRFAFCVHAGSAPRSSPLHFFVNVCAKRFAVCVCVCVVPRYRLFRKHHLVAIDDERECRISTRERGHPYSRPPPIG